MKTFTFNSTKDTVPTHVQTKRHFISSVHIFFHRVRSQRLTTRIRQQTNKQDRISIEFHSRLQLKSKTNLHQQGTKNKIHFTNFVDKRNPLARGLYQKLGILKMPIKPFSSSKLEVRLVCGIRSCLAAVDWGVTLSELLLNHCAICTTYEKKSNGTLHLENLASGKINMENLPPLGTSGRLPLDHTGGYYICLD